LPKLVGNLTKIMGQVLDNTFTSDVQNILTRLI